MFKDCKTLYNIKELKYLDTKNYRYFENMFYGCKSLSDIKSLENWKVSKGLILILFSLIVQHYQILKH